MKHKIFVSEKRSVTVRHCHDLRALLFASDDVFHAKAVRPARSQDDDIFGYWRDRFGGLAHNTTSNDKVVGRRADLSDGRILR